MEHNHGTLFGHELARHAVALLGVLRLQALDGGVFIFQNRWDVMLSHKAHVFVKQRALWIKPRISSSLCRPIPSPKLYRNTKQSVGRRLSVK